jgi:endo-1,4-beta-xylanase
VPSTLDQQDRLAEAAPFPLGAAIDQRETTGAAGEALSHHFTQLTAENHMKPEAWYDSQGRFAPSPQIATLMDYAQARGLRVYGHVLVWHNQTPAWFFTREDGTPLRASTSDQQILRDRLRTHIDAVAEYLARGWGAFGSGNPLVAWDVVNEVIDKGTGFADGMRRSEWYRVLGEEFVDIAFAYADEAFNDRHADPSTNRPVALFINDFDTETPDKQDRYHALVSRLLERGVRVDGVGHQMHVALDVPIESLGAALDRFAEMPVQQAVTELDVPTGVPVTPSALAEQGRYYEAAFRTFRERADVLFSVTLWGFHDGRSWRDAYGAPLLLDERLEAKPALTGALAGLRATSPS